MKKLVIAAALAACVMLCGCGEKYTFTLLEGEAAETAEMKSGTVIPGESLVYTAKGDVFRAQDYKVTETLTGVIKSPPERTVMDAYAIAKERLDAGERVLMIYIDGLGYDTFERAVSDGAVPCLAQLHCERAASVYPTITPVNYAAMVTGRPPAENGVTKRGIHAIEGETIFSYADSVGKTSYVSEGDTQILALPGAEMELSPDLNGSGTGDDEIFDCAMDALGDYDIVFVHFHSVDDASHANGPHSDEARAALETVDAWCAQLIGAWDGAVIVTADHGQHENDGTGDPAYQDRSGTHGDFAASDIFIPFMTN